MGHDTYAYKKTAYLRRSMWCEDRKKIYELLDCEQYYCGVSGGGHYDLVEVDKIKNAIKICEKENLTEHKEFLKDSIKDLYKNQEYVLFYFG